MDMQRKRSQTPHQTGKNDQSLGEIRSRRDVMTTQNGVISLYDLSFSKNIFTYWYNFKIPLKLGSTILPIIGK